VPSEIPAGFQDARTMDDGRVVDCDVCIVGAGAAGTVAALELSGAPLSVLVLEAGGVSPDPETTSFHDLEFSDLEVGPESRVRYLGGATNTWWGRLVMPQELDFAPRPWMGQPSWPVTRQELIGYFRDACRFFGSPDLTDAAPRKLSSRRGYLIESPQLATTCAFMIKPPLRFAKLLRRAVRQAGNLDALLYANLVRIGLDPGGSRVERLEVRTVNGRRLFVRPRTVVLACGGIENARILLASGGERGERQAVGNARDQVGRYFTDHPKGRCGVVHLSPSRRQLPDPGYWSSWPGRFHFLLGLAPSEQARREVTNCALRLNPELEVGRGRAAMREIYRRRFSSVRRPKLCWDLVRAAPEVASVVWSEALNRGPARQLELMNFMEQAPNPDNRVRLSDRKDMFEMPLPRLEWSISEFDRRSLRVLHETLDGALRRSGLGTLESPLLDGDPEPWPVSIDASHHLGTTRMGDDPSVSVVDRNCRVHGVDNLYLAGSSVFPATGYANPTLTIVALTLRLADHLRRGSA
jgi:choline dehydrogenase-like flavoprotein